MYYIHIGYTTVRFLGRTVHIEVVPRSICCKSTYYISGIGNNTLQYYCARVRYQYILQQSQVTIAILQQYYCNTIAILLLFVYLQTVFFSLHPHRPQNRRNLCQGLKTHLRWFEQILHLATKTCSGAGKESFGLSLTSYTSVCSYNILYLTSIRCYPVYQFALHTFISKHVFAYLFVVIFDGLVYKHAPLAVALDLCQGHLSR